MLSPGRLLPTVLSADRKKPRTRPLFHERKVLTFIMQDESHAPMRIFSFSNETRRRMLRRRIRKTPTRPSRVRKKRLLRKKINNLLRNRLFTHSSNTKKIWQAHRDSNSELSLRRGPFYPVELWALPEKANCSRFRGDSPRFPGSTTENRCVFRCTCLNRGSSFGSWRSPRELP